MLNRAGSCGYIKIFPNWAAEIPVEALLHEWHSCEFMDAQRSFKSDFFDIQSIAQWCRGYTWEVETRIGNLKKEYTKIIFASNWFPNHPSHTHEGDSSQYQAESCFEKVVANKETHILLLIMLVGVLIANETLSAKVGRLLLRVNSSYPHCLMFYSPLPAWPGAS